MALLSKAMLQALRRAPNDWEIVSPGPTIVALETRGLVLVRRRPDDDRFMCDYQWRITATGRVMDGRDAIDNRGRIVTAGNS